MGVGNLVGKMGVGEIHEGVYGTHDGIEWNARWEFSKKGGSLQKKVGVYGFLEGILWN